MFGVELICSDEDCTYVVEAAVWTLEQADALVCDECECTLQVTAVWDSVEVRARRPSAVEGAGAPDVIAA